MLKNLEVFDLSYNNLSDSDIASALSGLSSLKSLNLGNSQLTPRSILSMSHFLYFKTSSLLLVEKYVSVISIYIARYIKDKVSGDS